jgi:hypothetical protein
VATSKRKLKTEVWDVYEVNASTNAPHGGPIATFATHAEAQAFVQGIRFHDPRTTYAVMPTSKRIK